jgi:S1-C subfamily serine protease
MSFRAPLRQLALPAAAAALGGLAAVGGVALFGGFGGGTTTVVETSSPASASRAGRTTTLTVNEIYRRSAPGVVQITDGRRPLGSGFVIDKAGHIVTNHHLVEGADELRIGFSKADDLKASVVGRDPATDLAVLRVDASSRALSPLPIGDSDDVQVGDPVVAIGNPFGLERTATTGIVSALQRGVTAPSGFTIDHVIQTDARITNGNSGGPLLNERAEVIGVNSRLETGARGAVGFAVPSSTVKAVVAQILERGKVERAYIGVAVTEVTPSIVRLFRLPVGAGLLVEGVEPGSPAARAGLRGGPTDVVVVAGEGYRPGGDVIVAAAGERIRSIAALRNVLAAHRPGDTIELDLSRGGQPTTVRVKLGRQPTSPRR